MGLEAEAPEDVNIPRSGVWRRHRGTSRPVPGHFCIVFVTCISVPTASRLLHGHLSSRLG